MSYVHWTNHQIARLRQHYPTMAREDLEQVLAPHSWISIMERASYLGVRRRPAAKDWRAICAAHVMQTRYFGEVMHP